MTPPVPYLPTPSPALSTEDQEALTDLYVRGTSVNTLRAYERDLLYVTAWKAARFGTALDW
ncbi:MAG: integrase, partial [Ruegeria sp.]|nr:integrase [Ruegeria sp.]